MSLTIQDIKTSVYKMLEHTYGAERTATPITSIQDIESEGFMRKIDAESLLKTFTKDTDHISFRVAGADTLARIASGSPCKGHDIEDKSIKYSKGKWTYRAPLTEVLGKQDEEILDFLKGYVGSPYKTGDLEDIRYPTRDIVNKKEVFTYFLNDIYMLDERAYTGTTVPQTSFIKVPLGGLTTDRLSLAFTGDYDLHDLIVGKKRILSSTPEENSMLDSISLAFLSGDKPRKDKVTATMTNKKSMRYKDSPYSLVRHGAQTSFLDYLIGYKGDADFKEKMAKLHATTQLLYQGAVIKIDDKIAVFNGKQAYILRGVGQVYKYYVDKKIVDQIPFYNFFDALAQLPAYTSEIESYATYMNSIFKVNLGLIKHK